MILSLLNTELEATSIIDSYESLQWAERYNEYGDFELYSPATEDILSSIKQDYYLQKPDSEYVMIVEKIVINTDTEEGNHVIITGRSLESILERRIIWGQKTISGNLQDSIETLLNEAIISPSISARKIDNFIFAKSTDPVITALTLDAQYTGDNLYDVISTVCKEKEIGFKITLNDSNQFVFQLYSGKDRSYEQSENPYVVFSPNFENIINSNYIETKASLKNVTLVAGEDTGSDRKYETVGSETGLNRRELFTDARDIQSDTGDGKVLTEEEYKTKLQQRGNENLEEYKEIVSFEGEVETTLMFAYGEDFFIGDIVHVADEYGHDSRTRITEVLLSDEVDGTSVRPTFSTLSKEGE